MKTLFKLLVIIVLVLVALFIWRNNVVKFAMEKGVQQATGLPLTVGSVNLDIANTSVGITGLKLGNPDNFEDKDLFSIPTILVNYNLRSIMNGLIHLENLQFEIDEFDVVKNKEGKLNILVIKDQLSKGSKPAEKPAGPKEPAPATKEKTKLQIDSFHLKIGKVVYKDYSKGAQPTVQEFPINFDETFQDIKSLNSLILLISYKALSNTIIPQLANIDINQYKADLQNTMNEKLNEKLVDTVGKENADKVKEQADKLKNMLMNK